MQIKKLMLLTREEVDILKNVLPLSSAKIANHLIIPSQGIIGQ